MDIDTLHFFSWDFVLMATPISSTSKVETSSQQVMGPHHDPIDAIYPYMGEKLNGKN
jgi:hypothetical protein